MNAEERERNICDSTDEEGEGPLNGTAEGHDVEAGKISRRVAVDTGRPHLKRLSAATNGLDKDAQRHQ